MKDRVAKSVFWLVWSRGGIQVISLVGVVFVARLLDPRDYGLMALASLCTGMTARTTEMGLGRAVVQFRDLDDYELNACFWVNMIMMVLGYFALFACAPSIAAWFESPQLSDVLRVLGLTLPLGAVRVVPENLLRKRLALDKVAKAELASTLGMTTVTLGLALFGAGVWALVSGALTKPIVRGVWILWFERWWPGLRVRSQRFREIISYSVWIVGSRFAQLTYRQADVFVLGKLGGDAILGLYSMAKDLANMPANKISAVVNQIAVPVMAELQTDEPRTRTVLLRSIRMVASSTFPISVSLLLLGDDVVQVVLGDKWMPIVPMLQVLCIYGAIRSMDTLFPPVLHARYRTKFLMGNNLLLLAVMPVAFWVAALEWGGVGVALGWVLVYPAIRIRVVKEVMRELRIDWKTVWEQVALPLGATIVMVPLVLIVRWIMPSADVMDRALRLTFALGLGASVYFLFIFWRRGVLALEIGEVARWLVRKGQPEPAGK